MKTIILITLIATTFLIADNTNTQVVDTNSTTTHQPCSNTNPIFPKCEDED